ncbi:MAG: hypothetical protein WAK60_06355 [Sedimentisphaerales bacterium]
MAAKIDVKVDIDKELKKATRALSILNKLGGLGIFVVNAVFVGGLVWIYFKWVDKSSCILEFIQIALLVMASGCLVGVFFTYYFAFKRVDKTTVLGEAGKEEREKDKLNGEEKNDSD